MGSMDKIYDLTTRPLQSRDIRRSWAYPIRFGVDGVLETTDEISWLDANAAGGWPIARARYAIMIDESDGLYTYMILSEDFRWWDMHMSNISYDVYRPNKFQPSVKEVREIFEMLTKHYAIRRL